MHRSVGLSSSIILAIVATILIVAATIVAAPTAGAAGPRTYIVVYQQQQLPADAQKQIVRAGGTLVRGYGPVGVAIVSSDSPSFARKMSRAKGVEGVAPTASFGVRLDASDTGGPVPAALAPENGVGDPLEPLQWDMRQIHAPEARAVVPGDPGVVVGVISTGLDYAHPDLAANVDFGASVSCIGGVPNSDPAAWSDAFGEGTHLAGIVAAAQNGIGIVGIAPGVKVAGIKGCDDSGYCYPENVICSFMWAADHVAVVDAAFFVDPYEFNCHNDPMQQAIWKAVQRSVRYAQFRGVTVVSTLGNQNSDLAHPVDDTTNACAQLPVELSGVLGVSSDGNLMQKSFYSSYGVGVTDVVAPGGDWRFQVTMDAPNGYVLSTIPPGSLLATTWPSLVVDGTYMYLNGGALASAHAAGVAALVISRYGSVPPGSVAAHVARTADAMDCPPNPFDPDMMGTYSATCQGGEGYNSFYGHGQVNAAAAVSVTPDVTLSDPLVFAPQD